ncbi:glycosyltransferase [Liquorilactobacillus hordei]|uniref:Glycosyltransferase 2-like domain-containing protein n=1 Tax=Liquorilactobacillus hordei TaxID=468911 RepID=A0A3S6QNG0_9LACO|nr:glycosyltransferase [Liquorilactobacillus hordei]AUJ29490.1 hypothetical protein BSQ49_04350 [Liquorilactobacillus hordei]
MNTSLKVSADTIGLIIVTFNPNLKVLKNSIEKFSENFKVVICDNNSENIKDINDLFRINSNVILLKHNENCGIAKAQNDAIKFIDKEYPRIDYFCFFDQDSYLEPSKIFFLCEKLDSLAKKKVAIIGPTQNVDSNQNIKMHAVRELISSGSVIQKNIFFDVGFFYEKLFIDFVDYEWCWRARKKGYKVFIEETTELHHQIGIDKNKKVIGRNIIPPFRLYYVFRNCICLIREKRILDKERKYWIIFLIKQIIFNSFFCPDRLTRINFMLHGIVDTKKCKE